MSQPSATWEVIEEIVRNEKETGRKAQSLPISADLYDRAIAEMITGSPYDAPQILYCPKILGVELKRAG